MLCIKGAKSRMPLYKHVHLRRCNMPIVYMVYSERLEGKKERRESLHILYDAIHPPHLIVGRMTFRLITINETKRNECSIAHSKFISSESI